MGKFKRIIKTTIFCMFFSVLNACSDEDEMCEFTYERPDGNGNYIETTIEYPCKLGPPETEPVN